MDKRNVVPEQDSGIERLIRIDEIRVKCNFPIGQIKNLSIREGIGTHTIAEITTGISAGKFDIEGQELNSQPLVIDVVQEGEVIMLFSGVVSRASVDEKDSYETIHIKAYSLSWLMDLEKKSRSYQGETSICKLMHKISGEHSFTCSCFAEDKVTWEPFIQYQETDWEFLVRLSTHLHVPFYIANDYKGKGICLGLQKQKKPSKLNVLNEKWCMDADTLKSMNFDSKKAVYFEVISGQVIHLGQSVQYHDDILWAFGVHMVLQHGMLYCTYKLAGVNYDVVSACYNPHIKGISLTGTILDRRDETIKIHLDIDDKQDINRAYSYLWLPEHGNMSYCMPEKGSRVRLVITGEDERKAVGAHCVRQNGDTCQETRIPDNRWFSTAENKKLTLQPSSLELSGENGKLRISFQDCEGNSLRSSESILIQAKGDIVMQGTKVEMSAPNEITAIKRELMDPAVINICHNLDSMGKRTTFENLEELRKRNLPGGGRHYNETKTWAEKSGAGKEEERKKLQFELQKLFVKENEKDSFELGESIVNVISAIPQCISMDKLSRIAMGFRPITGRMKGE